MKVLDHYLYGCVIVGLGLLTVQCKSAKEKDVSSMEITNKVNEKVTIEKSGFGSTPDGEKVDLYSLKNDAGMQVDIITYGGIITSLKVPNKEGVSEDIVLGYNSLDQYIESSPYFGAIIGRYGNRIAKGRFSIDGAKYTLATNNGPNHLHGGLKGFDKVIWKASEEKGDLAASLKLSYLSKDMEEGYPGNLKVSVTYTLTDDHNLDILYEATTDKTTVVNLTQHSYFNLSGDFSKTILDHKLTLDADSFLPVDQTLIPTGKLAEVGGTPFDFRKPKTIGRDIDTANEQLKNGLGYDHCWVLNDQNTGVRLAATAYHPESGRVLDVFTDEPAIQFYTGNFLDGTLPKKGGGTYAQRSGFCLETQHYPDSPNQEKFPSVILNPGEKFTSRTSFKFSTRQ